MSDLTEEMCKQYCMKMMNGELGRNKFHIIKKVKPMQKGGEDVKVVSPTEQQIEQTKLQVKYDRAIKDPYENFYEQSFPKRRRVSTKIPKKYKRKA